MANGVTRVIERCEDATKSEHLDLSECQLMQMPDAVFHLMRNTNVRRCDLSSNVITKIPAKLGLQFCAITELNLSFNRLGKLPDELRELKSLEVLNIAHNAFLSMPPPALALARLKRLLANNNFIEDIDLDKVKGHEGLETLDLQENPLKLQVHSELCKIGQGKQINVTLSPITQEEWEQIPSTEET